MQLYYSVPSSVIQLNCKSSSETELEKMDAMPNSYASILRTKMTAFKKPLQ